jgi:heme exporter protein C
MGIASSPPVARAVQVAGELSQRLRPALDPVLGLLRRYGEYVLGIVTALGILVTIWAALVYAPTDITGNDQRIVYFHVPIAWVTFLAFFVVFCASIAYLFENRRATRTDAEIHQRRAVRWDRLAWSAAEVGVVFTTLTLITGSLWGKADWGVWWVWDARLTTTLILWFIYVGYLILRSYMGRSATGARTAAVVGIIGFIDVPIVYESVNWWNTIHPTQFVLEGDLPGPMLLALLIALCAVTLLFVFLLIQAYKLRSLSEVTEELRALVESEEGAKPDQYRDLKTYSTSGRN